jgi:hypothetical protein
MSQLVKFPQGKATYHGNGLWREKHIPQENKIDVLKITIDCILLLLAGVVIIHYLPVIINLVNSAMRILQ